MRDAYFEQLDTIVDDLVKMTYEVQTAVRKASRALLTADAEVAEQVITEDAEIDAMRESIEERSGGLADGCADLMGHGHELVDDGVQLVVVGITHEVHRSKPR